MKNIIFCSIFLCCSLMLACNRNIDNKFNQFEKMTVTTPFETTDKQTDEVESSTAEPSFIEWGIYVSNDNFNEFITIDDLYISFWDISKFDIGKMPEYYGEKGLPQCCKIYNRIEFLEHNDIFVSEEKIICSELVLRKRKWLMNIYIGPLTVKCTKNMNMRARR